MKNYAITLSLCFVGGYAQAKGLKDLAPATSKPAETKTKTPEPKKEIPSNIPADKVVEVKKNPPLEKESTNFLTDKFGLSVTMLFSQISGDVGDWTSGFAGSFSLNYRILPITDKMDLTGRYSYQPIDVLVKVNQGQYRGVADIHLFGSYLSYILKKNLRLTGGLDIGIADVRLDSINSIPEGSEDPEGSGFAAKIDTGIQWKFHDKVWFGSSLAVNLGSISGWSLGIQTTFVM